MRRPPVTAAPYFANHARRGRWPWSMYHAALERGIARALRAHGPAPRVLVVGVGLEPVLPGAPASTTWYGCDLDAAAIEACRRQHPELAARLEVCPGPYELPSLGEFATNFEVVVAKEVIEHLDEPERWAKVLAARVATGGELVLTTPNYGRYSTLPLLERTVLEWIARRDGYSRAHIHPSRFDRRRLEKLETGPGMRLVALETSPTGWALLARWRRESGK